MPDTKTGKYRFKRPDSRSNAKVRKGLRKENAKEALAGDLRVCVKRKAEKKEDNRVTAASAPLKKSKSELAAKKVKALNKKLSSIEALIVRQKAGESLDAQQLEKIESLEKVMGELDGFINGDNK